MGELEVMFFERPEELRAWFEQNHETAAEVMVGYYKKGTGKASITWPESVDEALCVGWIDGVRKSIDGERYKIRFTPRKKGSVWSKVNVNRVAELTAQGRMKPMGLKAFEARGANSDADYSHEGDGRALSAGYEAQFQADAGAWAFFVAQQPSYQKAAKHWVMSAKREATRDKRLATLIADSAAGLWIPMMRRSQPKGKG